MCTLETSLLRGSALTGSSIHWEPPATHQGPARVPGGGVPSRARALVGSDAFPHRRRADLRVRQGGG